MTGEDRELSLLRTGTALDVVAIQASYFTDKHQHRPTVVIVNSRCKAAICVEIMERLKVPAAEVIIEPLWLDSIPVIFSNALGDKFVEVRNNDQGLIETL